MVPVLCTCTNPGLPVDPPPQTQIRRDKAAEAKKAAAEARAAAETSAAARFKEEGNARYREGKFGPAIESYTRAISAAEVCACHSAAPVRLTGSLCDRRRNGRILTCCTGIAPSATSS